MTHLFVIFDKIISIGSYNNSLSFSKICNTAASGFCQKVECHILISQLVFTLEDFWEFLLHLFLPLNGVRRGCPR